MKRKKGFKKIPFKVMEIIIKSYAPENPQDILVTDDDGDIWFADRDELIDYLKTLHPMAKTCKKIPFKVIEEIIKSYNPERPKNFIVTDDDGNIWFADRDELIDYLKTLEASNG